MTGNALHSTFTFSPIVLNIQAASTVYTFDKDTGLWVEHAGSLSYNIPSYYCSADLPVCNAPYVNYWTGYVKFTGTPGATTFEHGVGYQWIYFFAPQSDTTVQANLPNAVWDPVVGAWLIGFSVYIWDASTFTQSYSTPFPSPKVEPVPASNYNPLSF